MANENGNHLKLSRIPVDLIKRPDRFGHMTQQGQGYLVLSDLPGEHVTVYSSIPAYSDQQIEVRVRGGAPSKIQVLQCYRSTEGKERPSDECQYRLRCRWVARPISKLAG